MTKPVAFLLGSDSDLPTLEGVFKILDELEIGYHVRILSAHRTPEEATNFAKGAKDQGIKVLVGAAGMAAHLAGAVAAHTVRPVSGVPIDSGPLQGFDALLSTVQMPGGIPVATVAVGKAGAKNAAYLAAQILAVSDADLHSRLEADRESNRDKVAQQNESVQASL